MTITREESEIKFRAGSNSSVRAMVTKKKPTQNMIEILDAKFQVANDNKEHVYTEWPVQSINFHNTDGDSWASILLWTNEIIKVFDIYYVRYTPV